MMRQLITRSLYAIAFSAMSATSPLAAESTESATVAPASAEGTRLASLVVPYDLFLQSNLDSFMFGFDETVKTNPDALAMFAKYPGIRQAIVTAQLDALESLVGREHVVLLGLVGRHNDQRYTKAELTTLNSYFASPIGKRMIAAEYKAVDQKKMLEALSGEDTVLTKQETAEIAKDAPQRIFDSLTRAEQVEGSRFWASPLGRKVNANGPMLQEITRVWLNDLNTTNLKAVEALSSKVVREFIAKSDAVKPPS